ncbi:long-chain acyl-CoA synthetase [Tamaricihabitans halophyticus]|uniref:Long-chain acyl-CoA synthetase n=1 Tax=Tamaricihabitans halophyticus TaxID=1262583 RepID=A0A4R2R0Y1_9PSEU|nr:AMP-binding protein [Tamaricihabitans halophyticus]TCP53101.1 long-chain acyl-CoA synthetase [Tamaricihabitans halophyticus]
MSGVADPPAEGTTSGNIADLLADAAERVPRHLALVSGPLDGSGADPVELTWSDVELAVNAEATRLLVSGIRPGDRVLLALPTSAEFAISLYAAVRAGAIAVPVGPRTPVAELRRLIGDCGASVVIASASITDLGELEPGVALLPPPDPGARGEGIAAVGGGEDIAVLSYTAGPIGRPRGVRLSHRALLANVAQCAAVKPAPVTANDRVLLAVPIFHAYGLGPGLLQTTAAGASAVLLDRFDVETALRVCRDRRISTIIGVPAIYQAFSERTDAELGEALATVRLMTSGAAPLPASVLTALRRSTGLAVYEGYGLTETGPVVTSTLVSGAPKAGSVGRALPGIRLRLNDIDGRPLDEDDEDAGTGRVAVQGANLFSGYWPDGAHGPDADGWFQTGDVGYLDADGDLHLVDRAGDLIIVNGFNVYPHEVELVLSEVEGVAETAVVGVPDERTGERVKAVVVLADGAELDAERLRAHCAVWLPKYKVPQVIEFAEALPHSATGKLRRVALRGAGVDTLGPWSTDQ